MKQDGKGWKDEIQHCVNQTIDGSSSFKLIHRTYSGTTVLAPNSARHNQQNKLCSIYKDSFRHTDTQQALPSTRVASWRNFVKNDTYTVAADASQVLITRRFLLQNEMCGWVSKLVPRLRISESHFVADFHNGHLFVVYPTIDIVWHSTVPQYKWHSNGESED